MFPSVNWPHVLAAAAAGFAVSMSFYCLPVMRKLRDGQAENPASAILKRVWNTLLYAYTFAWVLSLTNIPPLFMGIILVLVGMLRAAFSPDGWNRNMLNQPRNVRLVDNARFILMYVVMTGILVFWR